VRIDRIILPHRRTGGEPVYNLDADLVITAGRLSQVTALLEKQGFQIEDHEHSVNAFAPGSERRIPSTTDERYQAFPGRAVEAEVSGVRAKVASLRDVTLGIHWPAAPSEQAEEGRSDPACRDLSRAGADLST
jgi:hypothetical protein